MGKVFYDSEARQSSEQGQRWAVEIQPYNATGRGSPPELLGLYLPWERVETPLLDLILTLYVT